MLHSSALQHECALPSCMFTFPEAGRHRHWMTVSCVFVEVHRTLFLLTPVCLSDRFVILYQAYLALYWRPLYSES